VSTLTDRASVAFVTVAVIGAGSAGLAVAQALAARGLDFTVFEAGSGVGGNWRYESDSGRSSAYASLRTNVSRQRMSFRCYRLPLRGPAFLTHAEMLDYLERFTDRFGLRPRIRFRAEVTEVRPDSRGWVLTAGNEGTIRFDAVVIATGYNSIPLYPDLPGTFDGLELHSHDYRTPAPFEGKRVVVIGLGCSATELACEMATVARSVTIATRSSRNILVRRLGPIPVDWVDTRAGSLIPWRWRRHLFAAVIRMATGSQTKAGLPEPPKRLGDDPLSVCDGLLAAVRSGQVRLAPAATALLGNRVRFSDGSEQEADAILYGTGYRTAFPFLAPELQQPTYTCAQLYRGIVSLAAPNLFYAGLVHAHGALIPVFEAQANWIGDVLAGRLSLPATEVMSESVTRDESIRARDFDSRHGILWDRLRYVRALDTESRHARQRPGVSRRAAAPTVT
jgi:cation diffusion facilitator CzcD-associated flavoprotein CzcO